MDLPLFQDPSLVLVPLQCSIANTGVGRNSYQNLLQFAWVHMDTPLTDMQKLLDSSFQGEWYEEVVQNGGKDRHQLQEHQTLKLVGTWHTPEQFVEQARVAAHPMDENAVADITRNPSQSLFRSNGKSSC